MNREKLIAWAREADLPGYPDELERFAALVAAAEREACAQIVDANAERCGIAVRMILKSNAAAIRARGEA